jgi:hypothetical protein
MFGRGEGGHTFHEQGAVERKGARTSITASSSISSEVVCSYTVLLHISRGEMRVIELLCILHVCTCSRTWLAQEAVLACSNYSDVKAPLHFTPA